MTTVEILAAVGSSLMASALFLLGYLVGTTRGTRRAIDEIIEEERARWERLNSQR